MKRILTKGKTVTFDKRKIKSASFRPFSKRFIYFDIDLNEMQYRNGEAYDRELKGQSICFSSGQRGAFTSLATGEVASLDMFLPNACQTLPRYRYTKSGERVDNITDWAVAQFVAQYSNPPRYGEGDREAVEGALVREQGSRRPAPSVTPNEELGAPPHRAGEDLRITKDAIFAYCYAVLHDPLYREKYALNLKREFPRIPFYPNFAQWVEWGEALLKLHIDYEKVKRAKLTRVDTPAPKRAEGTHPKPKLKSNAEAGNIVIDEDTQLTGVPLQAWEYRLGNRSAIDWVLDQHKEKTPRDPTIREKFNTYRFADYKESCIELLGRVVTVSVETVTITEAMKKLDRNGWD